MAKITIKGANKYDILQALERVPYYLDIQLGFRSKDFGKEKLPGFLVKYTKDEYASREFTTLGEAIAYIRKLYKEHHGGK